MELSNDDRIKVFCSALTGILSIASANTILTGDPAAHAFRVASRAIFLLEEREFLKPDTARQAGIE